MQLARRTSLAGLIHATTNALAKAYLQSFHNWDWQQWAPAAQGEEGETKEEVEAQNAVWWLLPIVNAASCTS
jgi:hypothetical protein